MENKIILLDHDQELEFNQNLFTDEFEKNFYYAGEDLGCTYDKDKTRFVVWAPTSSAVSLNLYKDGHNDSKIGEYPMEQDQNGTWVYTAFGDLNGTYYTYSVTINNHTNEAVDPYAKAAGANGERGMVIDFNQYNPIGWDLDSIDQLENVTDTVIYELHIRDLSTDPNSGILQVGKFLGLIEENTTSNEGHKTGLDHIKELGITHLHLLPVFDYGSVDETKPELKQFNWGYDPLNYNVVEGSYSTDCYNGEVRVKEFKEMVKTLHENNIHVVMDMVYNHTYKTFDSNFNKIVPDYYYRKIGELFTNASGCGNEIASERRMVRKYMVDSVVFFAKEYHIDGFRFDLMGIHDIETMNEIRRALDEINPKILLYGEGWTCSSSPLDESLRAMKVNTNQLERIAMFNDDTRDYIKGSVIDALEKGFVNGKEDLEEEIMFSVVGTTKHKEVTGKIPWAIEPTQSINYVSAHDNYTLWDKLTLSCENDSRETLIKRNKLASAIVFTAQGIPFIQAGEELLRSKVKEDGSIEDNSYRSSDEVNQIKWKNKHTYHAVFEYYKGLIEFRKNFEEFRMTSSKEIEDRLHFIDGLEKNVVAYTIKSIVKSRTSVMVVYNANDYDITLPLKEGEWDVYINEESAGVRVLDTICEATVLVKPISCMVLVSK